MAQLDRAWTGQGLGQNWLAWHYVEVFTLQLQLYVDLDIRWVLLPVQLKFCLIKPLEAFEININGYFPEYFYLKS